MAAFTVIDGVTLGVQPAFGTFNAVSEFKEAVAVISYRFWQRRFKSDPAVIGRNITVDGRSFGIIAVMPDKFQRRQIH